MLVAMVVPGSAMELLLTLVSAVPVVTVGDDSMVAAALEKDILMVAETLVLVAIIST